jgi:predicted phage baseplate assembly protein
MVDSLRGRILPPDLDDRTWQELVDEAKALIPKYAPLWTDTSASDLGITLIELFAWLVEGLTYRLNRVPEKNYIAFLNLLGITREPAVPAHTFLTFTVQPSQTSTVTVFKGTRAQTRGTETEAPIVFETDEDLSVVPTNLKAALLLTKDTNGYQYTNITTSLIAPPANGYTLTIPASQAGQPAAKIQLALGFDRQTTTPIPLRLNFSNPLPNTTPVTVTWSYSQAAGVDPSSWAAITLPTTTQAGIISDTTNNNTLNLQQDGIITFTPPATWTSQTPTPAKTPANQQPPQWTATPVPPADPVTDSLFWLGVTITSQAATPLQVGLNYILSNAVSAYNALTITSPEALGQSDGTPFQVFQLQHYPLFKRPNTGTPYDHLTIQVTPQGGTASTWTQVDEFSAGAANCYRLNPVTGEISFGNFDLTSNQQGYGSIPPNGAQVTAQAYRYVAGGLAGMVGAGKINMLVDVSLLSTIASVVNTISSYDAADEEPIDDTMRRAPALLRTRDRAITAEDYEVLAQEATSEVFLVSCLEPRLQGANNVFPSPPSGQIGLPWMFGNIDRSPGNVNVIIVPDQAVPQPQPSKELLLQVQSYLDARRDLCAHLFVQGPRYLPIIVTVDILIWPTIYKANPLLYGPLGQFYTDTLNKVIAFFHPTRGGQENTGWQIGQSVFVTDLFKAIMPSPDVGYITQLTVQADTPLYTSPPTSAMRPLALQGPGPSVPLADYELVCSAAATKHTVSVKPVSTS